MSQEGEPQGAPGGGSEKKGGRPTPLDVAVPPGQGRHSWQKQDQQRCDTQPTLPGSALLLKMRSEVERSPAVRCCSGGPSAPELAVPAEKKMSVADSFAGFADSMASIASLPAEAQKDMIEYVRDLRELLAGGMLTGAGRLDFSLQRATGTLPCSAPLPHRPSCGALLLCLVC